MHYACSVGVGNQIVCSDTARNVVLQLHHEVSDG